MATEELCLTQLLEEVWNALVVFYVPTGVSLLKQAATSDNSESNNIQLLANLKQELMQSPPLTMSRLLAVIRSLGIAMLLYSVLSHSLSLHLADSDSCT